MSKCHYGIRSGYDLDLWMTSDLENLSSNAQSYDEYVCQVSLKSLHYVKRYSASWKDGLPDSKPKYIMPPMQILWQWRHRNQVSQCTNISNYCAWINRWHASYITFKKQRCRTASSWIDRPISTATWLFLKLKYTFISQYVKRIAQSICKNRNQKSNLNNVLSKSCC